MTTADVADFSRDAVLYQRVPINRPARPDGKPNRPLTAYHVSIEPAPTETS